MIRLLALASGLALSSPAMAQALDPGALMQSLAPADSGRIIQAFLLLTVLSLAPGILIMVTCFTRFIIALSMLRFSLGLQSTPANLVLISLALFMTAYVMAPTFDQAWREGVEPFMAQKLTEREALVKIAEPFRAFMLAHVRDKDLQLFADLSSAGMTTERENIDLRILVPAFMISELRRGFEIGFLIAVPFLIIDLVVATIIMSMGMMMMPPTIVAMPIKILFFVLIDGWNLLVGSLVRSFA